MINKKLTLAIVCVFGINFSISGQWTQLFSVFNYGRYAGISFSINEKAYIGLGKVYNHNYVNDIWEFNVDSSTWLRISDYPGAGYYENTSFVIDGKAYVCLGFSNSHSCQNDLWEYDPADDSWIQKADFPGTPRYGARAFVIGDSAFVIGGSYGSAYNYLEDVYMYHPETDSWTYKSDFPGGGRSNGTAFAISGYGYFGLGISNSSTPHADMWQYDPLNDSWSTVADFPGTPRNAPVNFCINDLAYVGLGGNPQSTIVYNDFYTYDPVNNSWELVETFETLLERTSSVAFAINNKGYIGLGFNPIYGYLTDLWELDPTLLNYPVNEIAKRLLRVYPNPGSNVITLEISEDLNGIYQLIITNIEGKEVISMNINLIRKLDIDVSALSPGLYIIRISNPIRVLSKRVIIAR